MTFSTRAFRDALGLFPTGVAVVTATGPDGERVGATVSSFNSVSLEPPLVLFSVARSARSIDVWSTAERYAVNILDEGQTETSNRFARSLGEKWAGTRLLPDGEEALLLDGTVAWFRCRSHARHDGGDHLILVGEVESFAVSPAQNLRPLVFFRGRYRQLDLDHSVDTPPGLEHLVHGW